MQNLFQNFLPQFAPNLLSTYFVYVWPVYLWLIFFCVFRGHYFHDFGTFLAQRHVPFAYFVPYLATAIEMIGGPLLIWNRLPNGLLPASSALASAASSLFTFRSVGSSANGAPAAVNIASPLHDVLDGGGDGQNFATRCSVLKKRTVIGGRFLKKPAIET